jgi:hypothetical protein
MIVPRGATECMRAHEQRAYRHGDVQKHGQTALRKLATWREPLAWARHAEDLLLGVSCLF